MSGCALYVASFRGISKRTCAVLRTGWMQVDPVQAKSVHRNDRSRIERGLEVFETTGEPISTQQVRICMCLDMHVPVLWGIAIHFHCGVLPGAEPMEQG